MRLRSALCVVVMLGAAVFAFAQEEPEVKAKELKVLEAAVGVWDAKIEVWSQGPDSPPITFSGVETNRPYGEYWISSDFDSEFQGQTLRVHSIVGYDLDQGKFVGTVIDHGPYSARMVGEYDEESSTVRWTTHAKTPDGKLLVQRTEVTQTSADERVLTLSVPGSQENELVKFMLIKYVRRK